MRVYTSHPTAQVGQSASKNNMAFRVGTTPLPAVLAKLPSGPGKFLISRDWLPELSDVVMTTFYLLMTMTIFCFLGKLVYLFTNFHEMYPLLWESPGFPGELSVENADPRNVKSPLIRGMASSAGLGPYPAVAEKSMDLKRPNCEFKWSTIVRINMI